MRLVLLFVKVAFITVVGLLALYYAFTFSIRTDGISGGEESGAEIIEKRCPYRLIQPDWLGSEVDTLSWATAEIFARMTLVAVLWIVAVSFVIRSHKKRCQG